MSKLTARQARFVEHYVETANATKAAIAAGYSEKTARFIGCENLTKPNIEAAINEKLNEKRRQWGAKRLFVINSLFEDANDEELRDDWRLKAKAQFLEATGGAEDRPDASDKKESKLAPLAGTPVEGPLDNQTQGE